MNPTFSVSEVYKTGWSYVKKNLSFLLISTFVFFVASMILNEISDAGGVLGILGLASMFLYTVFDIGLINIGVLVSKGNTPNAENFKTDWTTFWRVVLASIIVMIFVALGMILLIIPGIIIAVRLSLTTFLIVDKKYSFWPAIKESWEITKGHSWSIFGLFALSLLVAIVAAIPLGLGLILAVPFFGMVYVVMSQQIFSMKKQEVSKEVTKSPVVSNEASQAPLIPDRELEIKKEEIVKEVEEIAKKYKISEEPETTSNLEEGEEPKVVENREQ
jgi:uncharacterized membrane protein